MLVDCHGVKCILIVMPEACVQEGIRCGLKCSGLVGLVPVTSRDDRPYRKIIDRYVTRFNDEPLRYPGGAATRIAKFGGTRR